LIPFLSLYSSSPGFTNDDFMQLVAERAVKEEEVVVVKNKSKFLKAHTSSGHRRAVDEMLSNPDLAGPLGDIKAAEEVSFFF
jgi:protein pelota